jgi:hypothetical protein
MVGGYSNPKTGKLLSHSPPIIVLGMHRSGTSMLAKILSELGVYMGADLSTNRESRAFQRINKRLLHDEGAHWANPNSFLSQLEDTSFIKTDVRKVLNLLKHEIKNYGDVQRKQRWGWKDPRNTLTLLVWLNIFPEATVIHMIRNGIQVALSLHRREIRRYFRRTTDRRMFPPTIVAGYKLWQQYIQIGLTYQAHCKHFIQLRYEDIHQQPEKEIGELCQRLHTDASSDLVTKMAQLVKQPTRPSKFDLLHVNILLRLGQLDPKPLIALGYASDASCTHNQFF